MFGFQIHSISISILCSMSTLHASSWGPNCSAGEYRGILCPINKLFLVLLMSFWARGAWAIHYLSKFPYKNSLSCSFHAKFQSLSPSSASPHTPKPKNDPFTRNHRKKGLKFIEVLKPRKKGI